MTKHLGVDFKSNDKFNEMKILVMFRGTWNFNLIKQNIYINKKFNENF